MNHIGNFFSQLLEFAPSIAFALMIWGAVDNYFLTRYGGKLNRGFTIWKAPLKNDERQFLFTLKEDIVEKKKIGPWRTKTSFIMMRDKEVLIRYSNSSQSTSWPLIGYVDLLSLEPTLQYRLSLPMLMGTIFLSSLHVFLVVFLSMVFVISWLFETGGIRNYLSKKSDIYLVRQVYQSQKGIS